MYRNITIIPPKKIRAITKNSQGEEIVPAKIATWSLKSTSNIEMVKGVLVHIIKRKLKAHKEKTI